MRRQRLLLLAFVALVPSLVFGGSLRKEWWDCAGYVKLWAVSWQGPWNAFGSLELQSGPSNLGPWSGVEGALADSGCYFPAVNLRWYRVWALFGGEQAKVWVPLHASPRLCQVF